jgi:hypothetical protein
MMRAEQTTGLQKIKLRATCAPVVAAAGRAAMFLAAACLAGAGCGPHAGGTPNERGLHAAPVADPSLLPDAGPSSVRPDEAVTRWPPGRLDITFDDIKFDMAQDEPFDRSMLTQQIEQLQGRHVRIRGYILPSFRQRGITEFVLVRDNLECCFGPGAALFDCVVVYMEADREISYTVRPVTVEGTFAVEELKGADGTHLAVFRMTGRRVR